MIAKRVRQEEEESASLRLQNVEIRQNARLNRQVDSRERDAAPRSTRRPPVGQLALLQNEEFESRLVSAEGGVTIRRRIKMLSACMRIRVPACLTCVFDLGALFV